MLFFFFNDTATTEIYTLSLHDALPIFLAHGREIGLGAVLELVDPDQRDLALQHLRQVLGHVHRHHSAGGGDDPGHPDRKSTRLNSSHANISYAVFCLKKKKTKHITNTH